MKKVSCQSTHSTITNIHIKVKKQVRPNNIVSVYIHGRKILKKKERN